MVFNWWGFRIRIRIFIVPVQAYKEIHLGLHRNAKVSLPSKVGISAGFNRPLSCQLLMPGRFSQLCLDNYWCLVGFLNSALTITDVWSVFSTLPWQLLMSGRFSQLCLDNYWCLVGFLNSAMTITDAWSVFSTLPRQLLMPGRFSQLCLDNWCLVGFLNNSNKKK